MRAQDESRKGKASGADLGGCGGLCMCEGVRRWSGSSRSESKTGQTEQTDIYFILFIILYNIIYYYLYIFIIYIFVM